MCEMMDWIKDTINEPVTLYIAVAAVVLSILHYVYHSHGLPPGPTGIPYFGYWPFLSSDKYPFQLKEMTKKYGDVFCFTATGRTYIHLGSYKAAREAHITKGDCFAERAQGFNVIYYYLKDGLPFSDYEQWKTMRKFFLQQFRERGMNVMKASLSAAMYDPVKEAVSELKQATGKPVNIIDLVVSKSSKILQVALLGEDGLSEEELQNYLYLYADTLSSQMTKLLLASGTIAKYFLFPFDKSFQKGKKSHAKLRAMLYQMMRRRKESYDENRIRDIVDAYYKERNDRKAKNDETYKLFTDECLNGSLIQIIGDGVLFMGMFVSAFIQALVVHQKEQEKLYQELVEVCGLERDPEMDDKSKMTYTNAFISEVMRTTDILPLFPSLECTKSTTVNGYRIPKGAITVYNFFAAHKNPNDYTEPEKFNPSRFLVEKDKRPDMLPLFGIGRRSCMGEGFTMNQVFLFVTTFVKHFRLSTPPGVDPKSLASFGAEKVEIVAELRN